MLNAGIEIKEARYVTGHIKTVMDITVIKTRKAIFGRAAV